MNRTRLLMFASVYFLLTWWRAATERPDELAERLNRLMMQAKIP